MINRTRLTACLLSAVLGAASIGGAASPIPAYAAQVQEDYAAEDAGNGEVSEEQEAPEVILEDAGPVMTDAEETSGGEEIREETGADEAMEGGSADDATASEDNSAETDENSESTLPETGSDTSGGGEEQSPSGEAASESESSEIEATDQAVTENPENPEDLEESQELSTELITEDAEDQVDPDAVDDVLDAQINTCVVSEIKFSLDVNGGSVRELDDLWNNVDISPEVLREKVIQIRIWGTGNGDNYDYNELEEEGFSVEVRSSDTKLVTVKNDGLNIKLIGTGKEGTATVSVDVYQTVDGYKNYFGKMELTLNIYAEDKTYAPVLIEDTINVKYNMDHGGAIAVMSGSGANTEKDFDIDGKLYKTADLNDIVDGYEVVFCEDPSEIVKELSPKDTATHSESGAFYYYINAVDEEDGPQAKAGIYYLKAEVPGRNGEINTYPLKLKVTLDKSFPNIKINCNLINDYTYNQASRYLQIGDGLWLSILADNWQIEDAVLTSRDFVVKSNYNSGPGADIVIVEQPSVDDYFNNVAPKTDGSKEFKKIDRTVKLDVYFAGYRRSKTVKYTIPTVYKNMSVVLNDVSKGKEGKIYVSKTTAGVYNGSFNIACKELMNAPIDGHMKNAEFIICNSKGKEISGVNVNHIDENIYKIEIPDNVKDKSFTLYIHDAKLNRGWIKKKVDIVRVNEGTTTNLTYNKATGVASKGIPVNTDGLIVSPSESVVATDPYFDFYMDNGSITCKAKEGTEYNGKSDYIANIRIGDEDINVKVKVINKAAAYKAEKSSYIFNAADESVSYDGTTLPANYIDILLERKDKTVPFELLAENTEVKFTDSKGKSVDNEQLAFEVVSREGWSEQFCKDTEEGFSVSLVIPKDLAEGKYYMTVIPENTNGIKAAAVKIPITISNKPVLKLKKKTVTLDLNSTEDMLAKQLLNEVSGAKGRAEFYEGKNYDIRAISFDGKELDEDLEGENGIVKNGKLQFFCTDVLAGPDEEKGILGKHTAVVSVQYSDPDQRGNVAVSRREEITYTVVIKCSKYKCSDLGTHVLDRRLATMSFDGYIRADMANGAVGVDSITRDPKDTSPFVLEDLGRGFYKVKAKNKSSLKAGKYKIKVYAHTMIDIMIGNEKGSPVTITVTVK